MEFTGIDPRIGNLYLNTVYIILIKINPIIFSFAVIPKQFWQLASSIEAWKQINASVFSILKWKRLSCIKCSQRPKYFTYSKILHYSSACLLLLTSPIPGLCCSRDSMGIVWQIQIHFQNYFNVMLNYSQWIQIERLAVLSLINNYSNREGIISGKAAVLAKLHTHALRTKTFISSSSSGSSDHSILLSSLLLLL